MRHTDTSLAAWQSMLPHLTELNARMTQVFLDHDNGSGLSCTDIEVITGLGNITVSPALSRMRNAGLIEDSGNRSRTPSGRQAINWRLVSTPPVDQET